MSGPAPMRGQSKRREGLLSTRSKVGVRIMSTSGLVDVVARQHGGRLGEQRTTKLVIPFAQIR